MDTRAITLSQMGTGWPQPEFGRIPVANRSNVKDTNAYQIRGIGAEPTGSDSSGKFGFGFANKTNGHHAKYKGVALYRIICTGTLCTYTYICYPELSF